jgi:hypothetical protein
MPARGNVGKPNTGFPRVPTALGNRRQRDFHIPTATGAVSFSPIPSRRPKPNSTVRGGKVEITKTVIPTFPPRNEGLRRKERACVRQAGVDPRCPTLHRLRTRPFRTPRAYDDSAAAHINQTKGDLLNSPRQARTEGAGLRLTPDWNQTGLSGSSRIGELSASLHSAREEAYFFEEYAPHYFRSRVFLSGICPQQSAH